MKDVWKSLLSAGAALLCTALAAAPDADKLNRFFGIGLFDGGGSWDAAGFFHRTRLRFSGGNGRYAARLNRKIAGAQAVEMIVFVGEERKKVERISFTFSNKGDTADRSSSQIRGDGRTLLGHLTRQFGKSRKSRERIGSLSPRVEVWDLPGAKLCLELEKKEFVMLHIIPAAANAPAGFEPTMYCVPLTGVVPVVG